MNACILIVEDDQAIVRILKRALTYEGYHVEAADDGESGLELYKKFQPRLIILDWMLPGMDGLEFCDRIRSTEDNIPIIMLTAKSEDYDKITGLNIGADDYITKPFNPLELIARVKAQLRRYVNFGSFLIKISQ